MDALSQLLVEARAGDTAAFADFVRSSQAEVWRLCAHLVGPADADDATQETYVAAWHALPSFRGEASARTWLLVIARRSAHHLARRRRSVSALDRIAPGPTETPHPERCAELNGLMDGLDEHRRLALVLTQVLGLSYAEAAEVCGCRIGTIRSRVARARAELLESWRGESDRHGAPKSRSVPIRSTARASEGGGRLRGANGG